MFPSAVIFDFDGVIVDTEPLHYRAFQNILEPLNLGYGWNDYVEIYMGFDDRDAFREAFRQKQVVLAESELERLVAQKAIIFQEVIASGVAPYPGVTDLIVGGPFVLRGGDSLSRFFGRVLRRRGRRRSSSGVRIHALILQFPGRGGSAGLHTELSVGRESWRNHVQSCADSRLFVAPTW